MAEHAASFSSGELPDVGILLLRHDAAAGGHRMVQVHESELRGIPENDLFGQTGKVHHQNRCRAQELYGEIAIGNRVQTVLADSVEAEKLCDSLPIYGKLGTSQRGRSEWKLIHA